MSFGELVKQLRIAQKKTLREFCLDSSLDPSNWSKIERGVNAPPRDENTLARWARNLGLVPDTDAWTDFMDQADVARGDIPKDVLSNKKLVEKLPVFFRTVRGAELGDKELDGLIEKIREVNAPDDNNSEVSKQ